MICVIKVFDVTAPETFLISYLFALMKLKTTFNKQIVVNDFLDVKLNFKIWSLPDILDF